MRGALPTTSVPDEEALAAHVSASERRERGVFFTPRPLVERVLKAVSPFVPATGRVRIVDPACGAGAFLSVAAERWPRAELLGLDVNAESAALCRGRVPRARVIVGDALTGALDTLSPSPRGGEGRGEGKPPFELWVGNPPYNGTSPLLRSKDAWKTACAWMPEGLSLPKGTSLREDFVFFLLMASVRLAERPGALAFVTSATLLDTYAYAPVRQALLSRLQLQEVIELERGTFQGTRVVPCVTIWTSKREVTSPCASGERSDRSPVRVRGLFQPTAPEFRLKPPATEAEALEAKWRRHGEPLDQLIPVSFAGLKTRFDELLVDDDRKRLEARVAAFIEARDLRRFARQFELEGFEDKLRALKAFSGNARFSKKHVRPFLRYRGPNPRGPNAWCYVDRELIPRGDHRLRGAFDPHASRLKLVFNWRELPLAAHVIDEPGCVTMYRHSRFAPALVPKGLLEGASEFDVRELVPNVSARGREVGTVQKVFERVAAHVMSASFQKVWAPAFGTLRVPVIPLEPLTPTLSPLRREREG